MKLIVGLGNPGEDYARSRHNVGRVVADAFEKKFRIDLNRHEKDSMTGEGRVAGGTVKVAKPLTYMNLSGDAVRLLANADLDDTSELIVVYDGIGPPLGKVRVRPSGSAGTHNGMRSIVASLASERFPRLRFGVRGASYSDVPLRDYVLDDFHDEELPIVQQNVDRAVTALFLFARGDLRRAMNDFNKEP